MPDPTRPRQPVAASFTGPGPVAYQLRPVVGDKDHCNSKRRLPAYSIAGKGKEFDYNCSPGPKYGIEQGFTRFGPDGTPKAGISGPHPELNIFQTPSPAAYKVNVDPTKIAHPSYTMAGRTAPDEINKNPAPNTYTLPPCLGDKLVDKKSAPVAGVRSRPKIGGFDEDLAQAPGAGTYKTTDPNVYKRRGPTYPIVGRNELPGDQTLKPGPGAHKPENVTSTRRQAPAFSFGVRHSEYSGNYITQPPDNICN